MSLTNLERIGQANAIYKKIQSLEKRAETRIKVLSEIKSPIPPGKELRLLSELEIEEIVNVIVPPLCKVPELRDYIHQTQKDIIKSSLRKKRTFTEAIPIIKDRLRKHSMMGVTAPGLPIGLSVSDDIGASVMQGTLNTRHKAGSKQNASGGIKNQREIVLLTARSNPEVVVFFEEPQTFRSVMEEWRPKLVGLTLRNLYYDESDITIEEANPDDSETIPDWYETYANVIDDSWKSLIFDHRMIIRLRKDLIFRYKVSLSKLVETLKKASIIQSKPKISAYTVIHSPFSPNFGYVEIHILPNNKATMTGYNASSNSKSLYILQIMRNTILNRNIHGMDGIVSVVPLMKKVHENIDGKLKGAIKSEKKEPDGTFKLEINQNIYKIFGISGFHVANLCEACGLEVIEWQIDYVRVKAPDYKPKTYISYKNLDKVTLPPFSEKKDSNGHSNGLWRLILEEKTSKEGAKALEQLFKLCVELKLNPEKKDGDIVLKSEPVITALSTIELYQKRDEHDRTEREEKARNDRNDKSLSDTSIITILQEPSPIETASEYYYASVAFSKEFTDKGKRSTMRVFIDMDGIDIYRTYSNDAKELNGFLGIEGARNFLIQEMDETWSNSNSTLQPLSIFTAVDAMTHTGTLTSLSHPGITSKNIGYLAKSTVHAATKFMHQAAINNETDNIQSASTALIIGKKSKLGTGLVKLAVSDIKIEEDDEDNDFSNINSEMRDYVINPDDVQQTVAIGSTNE